MVQRLKLDTVGLILILALLLTCPASAGVDVNLSPERVTMVCHEPGQPCIAPVALCQSGGTVYWVQFEAQVLAGDAPSMLWWGSDFSMLADGCQPASMGAWAPLPEEWARLEGLLVRVRAGLGYKGQVVWSNPVDVCFVMARHRLYLPLITKGGPNG